MSNEPDLSDLAETFAVLFRGGSIASDEPGQAHSFRPMELPSGAHAPASGPGFVEVCAKHLTEQAAPIGVYPLLRREDGVHCVYWGCVDFDEGEEASLIHAKNLELVLNRTQIKGWVERSRSKGYHVWVFFQEAMRATDVRNGLLAACGIVAAPVKEVNPKQTELTGKGWGNGVRLPYPAGRQPGRNVILSGGLEMEPSGFVSSALASRCMPSSWIALSAIYSPPEALPAVEWGNTTSGMDLTGLAAAIRHNGPRPEKDKPDGDRSATLFALACAMLKSGHTTSDTLSELQSADQDWGGKYAQRRDGQKWLLTTVEKAAQRVRYSR